MLASRAERSGFEVVAESAEIQKTAALVHDHEDVDIARGRGLTSCGGPENPDVPRAVPVRNFEDCAAVCAEEFVDAHVSLRWVIA